MFGIFIFWPMVMVAIFAMHMFRLIIVMAVAHQDMLHNHGHNSQDRYGDDNGFKPRNMRIFIFGIFLSHIANLQQNPHPDEAAKEAVDGKGAQRHLAAQA